MDQQEGASPGLSDAPIYDGLIKEIGDAPTEARHAAERARREAQRTLHFGSVRAAAA